ncbi:hypothetical protein WICMUC_004517 [Wickerhamomyces mucosus]|uniref:Uncharacterized protein n=1 Tax=Wickerhamomyces mucosus TaxID=1378264 RepID=A0A9P8PI93_9ASCO|nr:hypothetical protein WICMUC_004517 [Wickerhamomyces mucosus]
MNKTEVSKVEKNKVIGTSIIQPIKTMNGKTNKAICKEEPIATPIAKSILSFIATMIAVTCSDALATIEICPFFNAIIETINSTALPKVAFNNPPKVSPTCLANSSVANANNEANGIIAKKFIQKIQLELNSKYPEIIPNGTNINK